MEAASRKVEAWIGGWISDLLAHRWGLYFFGLLCGGGTGWLSSYVYPHSFLKDSALRIANLGVAPLAAAYFCRGVAEVRSKRRPDIDPDFHFWLSLWFSLGFALVRFGFAVR